MMLSRSASPRGRKDWKRRESGAEKNTREIEQRRLSITSKTRRVSEVPRLSTIRGAEVCPVRGKGSASISNMRML